MDLAWRCRVNCVSIGVVRTEVSEFFFWCGWEAERMDLACRGGDRLKWRNRSWIRFFDAFARKLPVGHVASPDDV